MRRSGRYLGAALLLGLATGLGGCAQMAADSAVVAPGRTVEVKLLAPSMFYAESVARRRFGFLGVFAMAHEGERLVREHGLKDPSIAVVDALRRELPAALPSQAPGGARPGALLLTVRTADWEYRPFRGRPDQYYVVYEARFVLSDPATGRTLATDRCDVSPTVDQRLTEDELIADGARKLRAELAAASRRCLAALRSGRLAASLGFGPPVAQR